MCTHVLMRQLLFSCVIFLIGFVSGNNILTVKESPTTRNLSVANPFVQCSIAGPVQNIVWLKNGIQVSDKNLKTSIEAIENGMRSTLRFLSMKNTVNGFYCCEGTSASGESVRSKVARVAFTGPPEFTKISQSSATTLYNSSFRLFCQALAKPEVKQLFWNFTMYTGEEKVYEDQLSIPYRDGILSVLPDTKIAKKKLATRYEFSCAVSNVYGLTKSKQTIKVDLLRQPPIPKITKLIFGSKNVTVGWKTNFKDVLRCYIQLIDHAGKVIDSKIVPANVTMASFSFYQSPERYVVTLQCSNDLLDSDKVCEEFQSKPLIPANITYFHKNVNVTWKLPESENVAEVDKLNVMLYTTGTGNCHGNQLVDNTTLPGPNLNKVYTDLHGGIEYYLLIIGLISRKEIFRTSQTFWGPEVPPRPTLAGIDSNSVNVKVTYFSKKSKSKLDQACYVSVFNHNKTYRLNLSIDNEVLVLSDTQFIVGLQAKTFYTVSIYCVNTVGSSLLSNSISFVANKSLSTKPNLQKPFNVTVDQDTDKELNISWQYTFDPKYQNATFFIVCITAAKTTKPTCLNVNHKWQLFSATNNIQPGTKYTIQVAAANENGQGGFSDPLKYKTHGKEVEASTEDNNWVEKEPNKKLWLLLVLIAFAVVIAVGIICILYYTHARVNKGIRLPLNNRNRNEHNYGESTINEATMMSQTPDNVLKRLEERLEDVLIKPEQIKQGKILGEGEFGLVFKGELNIVDENDVRKVIEVAVKSIKFDDRTIAEKEQFINEGLRMKNLDHPNVMHLIGISLTNLNKETVPQESNFSPLVVLPFMKNGDLKNYLFTIRSSCQMPNFNLIDLMKFGLHIAKGMEYLALKKFIHRDLAARNCMLDENFNVLVSDFGLSRKMYSESYYRQTHISKMPVKWMAPESLSDNIFTISSDVWSFGVTMWEILTFCQGPYPGVDNHELYKLLMAGNRLHKPPTCSQEVWAKVVCPCWVAQSSERISFSQLVQQLETIIQHPPEGSLDPIKVEPSVTFSLGYKEIPLLPPKTSHKMGKDSDKTPQASKVTTPLLNGYDVPSTSNTSTDSLYL